MRSMCLHYIFPTFPLVMLEAKTCRTCVKGKVFQDQLFRVLKNTILLAFVPDGEPFHIFLKVLPIDYVVSGAKFVLATGWRWIQGMQVSKAEGTKSISEDSTEIGM